MKIPLTPLQKIKLGLMCACAGFPVVGFVFKQFGHVPWCRTVARVSDRVGLLPLVLLILALFFEYQVTQFPLFGRPGEWRGLLIGTLRFWGYGLMFVGLTCLVASRTHLTLNLSMVGGGAACLALSMLFARKPSAT